jgi:hypothetical protein
MNWMLVSTLLFAGLFLFIGVIVAAKVSGTKSFFLFAFALVIGAPGLIFAPSWIDKAKITSSAIH